MKLLGRDIDAATLLRLARERLEARGIHEDAPPLDEEPEQVLEPLSFLARSLEADADPTVGLPIISHRTGLGRGVVLAKVIFRRACQPFINEVLGRQRLFNGHVRDISAQLAAEVIRLRARVEALEAEKAAREHTARLSPPPRRGAGKRRR